MTAERPNRPQERQRVDYAQRNRTLEFRSNWFLLHRPESDRELIAIRDRALRSKRGLIAEQSEMGELPMAAYGAPGNGTPWFNIGPRNINGRVKAIAVDPTDPDIVYAAAASGGVWKTEDAGQSWRSLWHDQDALTLGAIAVAPSDPDRVYAGTGEGVVPDIYGAAHNYPGVGLYVSTDAGATWTLQSAVVNRRMTRVLVDPLQEQTVYVAGPDGLEISTDGGVTWTILFAGVVSDAVIDPNDGDTIYICVHLDGVYKTTDGGSNWTQLTAAPTGTALRWPRIDITSSGTYGSDFLVLKNSQTFSSAIYYTTTDGGTTWNLIPGFSRSNWEGWCDLVAIAPDDEDYILAGGVGLSVTTDGGATWSNVAGMHADHHRAQYAPSNPSIVYTCDDGGVYRSTDKGVTFKKVSHGLVITQFYDVGSWNVVSNVVGGGTQDQGTNMTGGGLTWNRILGADGGYLVFDPTDPRTVYAETQGTAIRKSTDGGGTWSLKTSGLTGTSQWVGTIVMDPNDHLTLYTGGREVFKSSDGLATAWVSVSQDFGFDVNVVAVASSDSNRVYCGTGNFYNRSGQGRVFRTDDAGATPTWSEITGALPSARPVMDIVIDASNEDRVFVSYGGTTGGAASHVFMSTNAGGSWTDISGNLPDISVSALALDPNDASTVYAGTDVGVFVTNNLGTSWLAYDNGIPNCPIHDLHADSSEEFLYAATFGRGMYKLDIAPVVSTPNVDLYIRDSILDVGQLIPSPSGHPNPNDVADTVRWWESPDLKTDRSPFFTPDGLFDGVEFDDDLTHEDPDRGATNRFYLQVHNRGYQDATNVRVRAFSADASAGLPALPAPLTPPDFNLPAGAWIPVGPAQTIPVLEPNRPEIVTWDFAIPLSAATHSCVLAVVSSNEDPITTSETNVDILVPNEKRVGLKNLHVVGPLPAPAQRLVTIDFHNAVRGDSFLDIIIQPEEMDGGVIGLALEPHEMSDALEALRDVRVVKLEEGEDLGEWQRSLGRGRKLDGDRERLDRSEAELKEMLQARLDQMDLSFLYEFSPARIGEIRGIRIPQNGVLRGLVTCRGTHAEGAGRIQRFAVIQRQEGRIVGGSTYELRSERASGMYPVSLIRIVLEKIQILDDTDPCLKAGGELVFAGWIVFNANENRRHRVRIPERGHISVSDRTGDDVAKLDCVLYEGYAGLNDNLSIYLLPTELDLLDADDRLTRYRRVFTSPPETWVGSYSPEDEPAGRDPESTDDWRIWYRIESLPLRFSNRF